MPIDFPTSPSVNDTYTFSGKTWKWNGEGWELVSDSVTTGVIADGAVTYAKIQNVSATDRLLGRSTAGAGVVEEIVCTASGRNLLDDTSTSAQRTTLGLGTLATQSSVGNISSTGAIGVTANLPIITTTSGVLTTGTFGTTANSFCQGNDSRLSDTRNTTNSLTFNNGGTGAASGTTFNGSTAQTISYNTLGAAPTANPTFTGTGNFVGLQVTSTNIALTTGVSASINALWSGAISGASTAQYHYCNATVSTTAGTRATTSAVAFSSGLTTANAASAQTFTGVTHFEVAPVAKGTNTTITNQYGFVAGFGTTAGTNNYGFYSDIQDATGRFNFYANNSAPNYFNGTISSLGSYNSTTATAANAVLTSTGLIQRSTSSIRYKTDIENIDSTRADSVVLNARPVWYRSLCDGDNQGWSWYGLIAEEVAALDPRLVFWGRPTKEVLDHEAKDAVLDSDGNEIEPAREAIYKTVEDENAPLQPEGVQYDRLTVMLLSVVQRQQKAIDELRQQIAAK